MNFSEIISNFNLEGEVTEIKPYGEGHINRTYLVCTSGTNADYILQNINDKVFGDIDSLMNNISVVLMHLAGKEKEQGEGKFFSRQPRLVPTLDKKLYFTDGNNGYWRCLSFIPDAVIYQNVPDERHAHEAGRVIGEFQSRLSDLAVPLAVTNEDFHDIYHRLDQFDRAVQSASKEMLDKTAPDRKFVTIRRRAMQKYHDALMSTKVPVRVTHNDTKLNNILFDSEGNGICMIDLDTVMPGFIQYDFGDALRTLASTAAEDETDLGKVNFDLKMFRAFSQGYVDQVSRVVKCEELELLPFSPLYMTYIIGLRFLTDHLKGNVYFRVSRSGHNLDRARAQFRLLESMEVQMRKMETEFQEVLKMKR